MGARNILSTILYSLLILNSCSGILPIIASAEQNCCGYHDPAQNPFKCYDCGNCTWWARYKRPDLAECSGYAYEWIIQARDNHPTGTIPQMGAIAVFSKELMPDYGHVAYVEEVSDCKIFRVSEMSYYGDFGCCQVRATNLYVVKSRIEFIYLGTGSTTTSQWEFLTNGVTDGWTACNVENYSVNFNDLNGEGIFFIDPAKSDPYIISPLLSISASDYNALKIRMASNANDGHLVIYFKTKSEPDYKDDKMISYSIQNDAQWHEYSFSSKHEKWSGIITGIRIDPADSGIAGSNKDIIKFDYIRLIKISDGEPPDPPQNLRIQSSRMSNGTK